MPSSAPPHHPTLGPLQPDADGRSLHATASLDSRKIEIWMHGAEAGECAVDFTTPINRAAQIVDQLDRFDLAARSYAGLKLFWVQNRRWSDEGYPAMTAEQIRDRVRLDSISVLPDGRIELFLDDNDIFAGHAILVEVGPNDSFRSAHLAG